MSARTARVIGRGAGPLLLVLAVVLGTAVPSAAAPVPAAPRGSTVVGDPRPPAIEPGYLRQRVEWTDCSFDEAIKYDVPSAPTTRCGQVRVPMDWLHPGAHPDITVAVAWSRATGPTRGLLTVNPGGPGAAGLRQSAELGSVKPRLFAQYDLVGFDPRGFGDSENYRCLTTQAESDARPTVPDRRVRGVKTHAVEVADAKFYAEACSSSELSRFVGTQQTVYDMEFLRRYLGADRPAYDRYNVVGLSYGTWLGSWYADTYPSHTGRMLLDSNMDVSASMSDNQANDSFSFERRRDEMFFPWVARQHARYGYGRTTAEVRRNFEVLRVRLSKAAALGMAIEDPVTFDNIIAAELYVDSYFPETIDYISFVERETPGGVFSERVQHKPASAMRVAAILAGDADQPVRRTADDTVEVRSDYTPVHCNDSRYSRDLRSVLRRADADRQRYPFRGYQNTVNLCAFWPFAPLSRTIDLTGAPTVLMIQSEGDPATAYEGARAAHRALAGHTRLVSVDDEGEHGVYSFGVSTCAERIGDAFLYDGVLPSRDVTCPGEPLPLESEVYPLDGPVDHSSAPSARASRPAQTGAGAARQRSKVDTAARALG